MNTKLVFILITTGLLAYSSGVFLEAVAFGDDSKLYRFATSGKFDSNWVPFFIDGNMAKIEKLKNSAAFETFNSNHLIEFGELSGTSSSTVPIGSASVGFGVGIVPIKVYNEPSLQNVVDKCYFISKDSFSPLCVICEVLDKLGHVVGTGKVDTGTPYTASTTIPILLSPEPAPSPPDSKRANDVQKVTGVKLTVCAPPGKGCTPGFWKNHATTPPWKTYTPGQKFVDVFQRAITISSGPDPTLLQALGANGGCVNALARHTVAALLNAAAIGPPSFPFTTAQVISKFKAAYDTPPGPSYCTTIENQKNEFALANEKECPFGNEDPCKGLKSLTLKYTGTKSPVKIQVSTGGSTFKTFYSIPNGGQFTITPQSGQTKLPATTHFKIFSSYGKLIDEIDLDTSCKPISTENTCKNGSKLTVIALVKIY